MIFDVIYGSYFNAINEILTQATNKSISNADINKIVREKAFLESDITIPSKIVSNGEWALLDENNVSIFENEPKMGLTLLQKRWLKSLLNDPRIKLFNPDITGLEDIEPLFERDVIIYYDQFLDGDPFEDEIYINHFRLILRALKENRTVAIEYKLKNGTIKKLHCNPRRLEYSLKDDKFRLISSSKRNVSTINLSKIVSCQLAEYFDEDELTDELYKKRTVEILLEDKRQVLDRALLQFSTYEKITKKLDDKSFLIQLTYEVEDEIDILIKVLSLGPSVKVVGPDSFIEQIKNRLRMQKNCEC